MYGSARALMKACGLRLNVVIGGLHVCMSASVLRGEVIVFNYWEATFNSSGILHSEFTLLLCLQKYVLLERSAPLRGASF